MAGQMSLTSHSRQRYGESGPRNAPRKALNMKTILVPLDGSPLADRAVPFAATLAARAGWQMLLVRAVSTLSVYSERAGLALKHEAQEALDATAAPIAAAGIDVMTRVI